MTLLKRMALVIDDGVVAKVFYPVFPPDRNAEEVIAWLERVRVGWVERRHTHHPAGFGDRHSSHAMFAALKPSYALSSRNARASANTSRNIFGVSTPVFVL